MGRPAAIGLCVFLAAFLAGCSTVRHTEPQRTATEQLMISSAADRAADGLAVDIPAGARVFVNADTFEGYDQKYALGAIRERILLGGARLVGDRKEADVIVDVRSGALSLDRNETLVGIPEMNVPIPLAGALKIPEIALFKREMERGVAKFAMTAYGREDGRLIAATGPAYGFARRQKWVVLLFVSWTTSDFLPSDADKRDYLDIDAFR